MTSQASKLFRSHIQPGLQSIKTFFLKIYWWFRALCYKLWWFTKSRGLKLFWFSRSLLYPAYWFMRNGILKLFWLSRNLVYIFYWKIRALRYYSEHAIKSLYRNHLVKHQLFRITYTLYTKAKWHIQQIKHIINHKFKAKTYQLVSIENGPHSSNHIKLIKTFDNQESISIDGPRFFGVSDSIPFAKHSISLKTYPVQLYTYESGIVIGSTNFILVDDNIYHPSAYKPELHVVPMEICGLMKLDKEYNSVSLYTGKQEHITEAISLLGSCTANYAHWLTETLPKLLFIDQLDEYKDLPLLVDEWIHPNFELSIRLFGLRNREITKIKRWSAYRVDKLIDVTPTAHVPPEYRTYWEHGTPNQPDPNDFPFSKLALNQLRGRAHELISPLRAPFRKLFLFRSPETSGNPRHLRNMEQVLDLVSAYDFEVIDPAKLSLTEQIQVFSQASLVISPLGAALANMCFTPPGCRILGLSYYYEGAGYYYFSNFMEVLGHELHYILGKPCTNHGHPAHQDYEVDINALAEALANIVPPTISVART